jgi:DNA-directed RNA polymerase specialized sigma24 family protein
VDKYVEELSVAQIAARTGKSPKAVESLLSRAREQFRALLRWYVTDSSCRNEA